VTFCLLATSQVLNVSKIILDLSVKIEGYNNKITLALAVTSVTRYDELMATIWMPEYKLLEIGNPEADFIKHKSVASELLQS
jgi:hypothetical protein